MSLIEGERLGVVGMVRLSMDIGGCQVPRCGDVNQTCNTLQCATRGAALEAVSSQGRGLVPAYDLV